MHTLLSQPPSLMRLQLILPTLTQHRHITSRLRVIQHHGFIEEFEAIDFVDGASRRLHGVEDNKRLSFRLQVRFRDDFEYRAVFGEDLFQCFF